MVRLTVKDEAVLITAANGAAPESVYTYDRAGRLFAAWVGQRFYRRGLDNRLVEKHTVHVAGVRTPIRRTMGENAAAQFLDQAAAVASEVESALGRGDVELLWSAKAPPSIGEAIRLAAAAAAFDAEAARLDGRRFATVYRPVGILPPDQYLALVLQITEGCHWNRCTFCTFYRQIPFHVKSIPELEAHLGAVTAFLGESISLRRSLFLGEANALVQPTEDLAARLDLVRQWFAPNGSRPKSIYSFLDIFTGRRKSVEEYTELRWRGLRRVYLGVETGDDELLRFLNKPQQADDAAALVRTLKAAGLAVGVIVMAGVGGAQYARSHLSHTLELLNGLPLGTGDLIYLSAFVARPHADYLRAASTQGIRPLSGLEIQDQIRRFREGLRCSAGDGPCIARYDIEEFIY